MQNRLIAALTSRSGLGAMLLFAAAAVTFSEVSRLRLGTPASMGPGYFPALLGGLFVLFGVMLLAEGWRNPGQRVNFGRLRPVIYLLGAIILFGMLYPVLGGGIAIAVLVTVSAMAEPGRSWQEIALLVVTVIVMIWVIFVLALGLQLTMLPPWIRT
ncbi:tripartite tricarboxylate transporter TctB family protein [Roseinatronobacter alkalisoli]|uniref:Tripartite tricarboxylate transporter TctB family protein n=1 Tax=Roseinatronobacter alkalisoli TaxID=3028235 RepID=A0ABT5TDB5_9RHOB|nr:tripartite tricarboxylate transporter TctB family protein [Roseinatronobacter sp. HJB301]MDD7973105.1 tripartite tricarboxylate transporter TctB family protein [Roseinatronobacter sp. HJB301]